MVGMVNRKSAHSVVDDDGPLLMAEWRYVRKECEGEREDDGMRDEREE